jgi:glycosyltransferase involved in cell wall biosynthesis
MSRRVLVGCYEVPGYGGASTASYRLLENLRSSGFDVSFVNLVDEQDAEFFHYVFGSSYGNPKALDGVHNCVLAGPLYHAHPELSALVEELAPDIMIGTGYIGALLLKRAAPERKMVYLTSGCQQLKDAITRGQVTSFLDAKREIDRGIRRPGITCREELEAMDRADLVVVHSEMTRTLCHYFYPHHVGKVLPHVLWFANWIYADALDFAPLARPFADRDVDALFVAASWNRPEKNFSFVQRIAARLGPSRVHVVGELEKREANAVYHGLVADREELFGLMGRARTVVCPSVFDAAPGILFEASALGCNIVASENCGNAGICNDSLLVTRFSPDAFAANIAASLTEKYADHVDDFLETAAYGEFTDTLDVL